MREPFPYESDTELLTTCLVPDPLSSVDWKTAVGEWRMGPAGVSLAEHLVLSGHIGEAELLAILGSALGVRIHGERPGPVTSAESPDRQLVRRHGFLPLGEDGLKLLAGGPEAAPDLVRYLGPEGNNWEWVLISPLRDEKAAIPTRVPSADSRPVELRELLLNARACGAADLYLELAEDTLDIRMRTPLGIRPLAALTGEGALALVRMVRQMANFSTAENALPQDGRIRIPMVAGGDLIFRVSQIPTVDGASIVLRQLGGGEKVLPLRDLGVPASLRGELLHTVRYDTGLILVTGATGSGKTTTLYGLLREISSLPLKILTIEDPVEYELPAATQSNVDERCGWTFDRAIRAFLRQDPDVILVGEIRDPESAVAACRAALTGHVVLASLHASGVGLALDRLRAWNIPEGILHDSVRLVLHQRLLPAGADNRVEAVFRWERPFADSVEPAAQVL